MIEPFGIEFSKLSARNTGLVVSQGARVVPTNVQFLAPGNPPIVNVCIPREHCGLECVHMDSSASYQNLFLAFEEKTG